MARKKLIKKTAGRPRLYADAAERVRAFRVKAAYPGKRYDVYLGKDAHVAVVVLMKKHKLPASGVIDAVMRGTVDLPSRELDKWFAAI